ncbi:MAG: membrane protein insertase YidC [Hydrogenothermaceae bacterium]|nr:membrane protein insertase YidC [Hydrogenothermaceae bacterium]
MQEDTQKRMLIFFVAVSILVASFSFFSSYLFPQPKEDTENKQKTTAQTSQAVQKIENYGDIDFLLGTQRQSTPKENIKISTPDFDIQFTPYGGRITSIFVKRYNQDMISDYAKNSGIYPGDILTNDKNLTNILNLTKYEVKQSGNTITFSLKGDGFEIFKTYTLNNDGSIDIQLNSKGLEKYNLWYLSALTLKSEGSFGHEGPIIKTKNDILKYSIDDIKSTITINDKILWAGEENKYFFQILSLKEGISTVKIVPLNKDTTAVLVNIPSNFDGFVYGGAKLYSLLGDLTEKYEKNWNINLDLRSSIDFGFFGIFGKPLFLLLHFFYEYIPNWGVAIIILTVLIRIIFFPLNHKSLKAMKKMADLAPEMEKLKKKYAKDPQKLQEEMMKLYAQAGANPLSGCLPILVQIPVFIALYNVLMVTVELKGAPFILWIKDLSDKDPYYILPILMGLSMIAQQFITPSTDKNQQIIMYVIAVVFTFMFLTFPSGLVLYWLTNNILGLIQSFIVNKTMKK